MKLPATGGKSDIAISMYVHTIMLGKHSCGQYVHQPFVNQRSGNVEPVSAALRTFKFLLLIIVSTILYYKLPFKFREKAAMYLLLL